MKKIQLKFILILVLPCILWATPSFGENKEDEITIDFTSKYLVAPSAAKYQWYHNNLPLEGGIDRLHAPSTSGQYAVELTDEAGNTKRLDVSIVVDAAAVIHKVYLIGDSTVANYTSGYYPQTGWGQVFQKFFNSANVGVDNRAVGGTSAKSFYNIYWTGIKNGLQAGDYVFIQFGINDSNKADTARYTVPFTTFQQYLTKYVNEARSKGAIPVLVATLCRNSWNATTPPTVYPAYHDYPVATRQLAQSSLNVPLIDLDQKAVALLQSVGPEYATNFFYMNLAAGEYPNYASGRADNVHFQEMGAIEMAKLVAQGVSELSQNSSMSFLAQNLLPTYQVTTSSNSSAAGIITRTTTYPAGVTVTVKGRPATGHTFIQWNDVSNNAVMTTTPKFSFTMGTSAKSYKGYFDQVSSTSLTVQESTTGFCSVDGTIDSNNAGFTGTGFANANNAIGSGVNWKINSGSGSTTLTWRYSNGGGSNRPGRLLVNGTQVVAAINFAATTNWTTWSTASATVTLSAGANTIRLEATAAAGLANIDQISITGTNLLAVSCASGARTTTMAVPNEELQIVDESERWLEAYPNPSSRSFHIRAKGTFNYVIYDQLGRSVENGSGIDETEAGAPLKSGSYTLKVKSFTATGHMRLIKQ